MTSSPSEVGRITLERVTFRYLEQSKRPVLDEVSASFDRSRITVLTGPSGCGKSTLLYLAAGIYPQNAGFLQGARCGWRDRSPPPWGRGAVRPGGHAVSKPGAPVLYGHGGERAVLLSGEPAGAPGGDGGAAERRPGLLRHRPPAPPPLRSLSGGEKQRAALACLAALRLTWVLLDEPFANLDDQTAALLCGQLARLHRECGTGILAIDHRLDHWLSIADEIRLMAQDGTLDGAAYAPSALSPQAWAERGVSVPGCPYQAARPVKTGPEEVVLSLRGLRVSQDGREVLRDVNADFFRGASTPS
ncbi:ATP-binding cassette domain-containing protein [Flavonifractor plautii]|nr:ATP-binding cassette domain-containing protein [Flavonifractor plautii]